MLRHRGLAIAAYLVGATLILLPLFDAVLSISPLRFGDVRWRFGAAGLLANALLIPNAGLLLMLITAISNGNTTLRRVLGACALGAGVIWVLAIGMFGLDALQMGPPANPAMSLSFTVASYSALAKMLTGAATLFVLGLVGIRDGKESAGSLGAAPILPR